MAVPFGSLIMDGRGATLYAYANDTPSTVTFDDPRAQNWPPLLTSGQASVAGRHHAPRPDLVVPPHGREVIVLSRLHHGGVWQAL